MIKELFFTAALLAPVLAYGGHLGAPLLGQVVPAGDTHLGQFGAYSSVVRVRNDPIWDDQLVRPMDGGFGWLGSDA
jgi:hypothetical protein